jgi:hypothetical protein
VGVGREVIARVTAAAQTDGREDEFHFPFRLHDICICTQITTGMKNNRNKTEQDHRLFIIHTPSRKYFNSIVNA